MAISRTGSSFVSSTLASLLLWTLGCGGADPKKNEPPQTGPVVKKPQLPPNDSKGKKPTEPETAKADLSLKSDTFAKDFQKYGGKRVELTGDIVEVGRANGDADFVILSPRIQCVSKEPEPWKKAWPGQTVKLVGTVVEFSERPGLYDCVIVGVLGSRSATLSVGQLAKEYSTDPVATTSKYADKQLVISGPVLKVEPGKFGEAYVFFRTETKGTAVLCHFNPFAKNMTDGLKAGQEITVSGEFTKNSRSDSDVGLRLSTVLESK